MANPLRACQLILFCIASSPSVSAQDSDVPKGSLEVLRQVMQVSDSGRGRFQLELPIISKPLTIAWQVGSAPSYELLRWPTYDWQTSLLSRGPLEMSAFNRVKPAIELDCLSTKCEPIQEKTVGAEMRVHVGGRGALPRNYLFLRREMVLSPIQNFTRLGVGIGGLLDL